MTFLSHTPLPLSNLCSWNKQIMGLDHLFCEKWYDWAKARLSVQANSHSGGYILIFHNLSSKCSKHSEWSRDGGQCEIKASQSWGDMMLIPAPGSWVGDWSYGRRSWVLDYAGLWDPEMGNRREMRERQGSKEGKKEGRSFVFVFYVKSFKCVTKDISRLNRDTTAQQANVKSSAKQQFLQTSNESSLEFDQSPLQN